MRKEKSLTWLGMRRARRDVRPAVDWAVIEVARARAPARRVVALILMHGMSKGRDTGVRVKQA
jgi:hypothetical protein